MYYQKSSINEKYCKVDLHLHSTASDGICKPSQLVEMAWHKNVKIIAITDHDTISGIAEAQKAAQQYQIEVIPGIELSTEYKQHEIHILGYYFDSTYPELVQTLTDLRQARLKRAEQIIEKLNNLGISISFEEVMLRVKKGVPGRPHIALELVKHGVVKTIGEAFDGYLNPGCPAYIPRYKLLPQKAIRLIREAGGIPVLAHPGLDFPSHQLLPCIEAGLLGVEIFHPDNSPSIRQYYTHQAKMFNLIITGGSDFHGHDKKDYSYFGNIYIPQESLIRLHDLGKKQ